MCCNEIKQIYYGGGGKNTLNGGCNFDRQRLCIHAAPDESLLFSSKKKKGSKRKTYPYTNQEVKHYEVYLILTDAKLSFIFVLQVTDLVQLIYLMFYMTLVIFWSQISLSLSGLCICLA